VRLVLFSAIGPRALFSLFYILHIKSKVKKDQHKLTFLDPDLRQDNVVTPV
jgi:hypothetical protein